MLLPLTWAIMIHILTYGFGSALGLSATAIVSFILAAVTITTLSSFKILDSGLSDGANRMLFILIFGGLFYGITVSSLYIGNLSNGSINNSILTYPNIQSVDIDLNNIPPYISKVVIAPDAINPMIINNPNYDSTVEIPEGTEIGGFGVTANTGLGNETFTDMPYFSSINVVFGLLYMLGMYFMVAK